MVQKQCAEMEKPTVAKREDVYIDLYCVILSMVMPQIHSSRMNGKCWHWWHDIGLRAAWLPSDLSVANLDAMLARKRNLSHTTAKSKCFLCILVIVDNTLLSMTFHCCVL